MKATANDQSTKTIVLVGGDKGGVGKSTVARTLAEYYTREKVSFKAFDGDDTNPTFLRFFKNAERLYTKAPKGFEPLINNLEGEVPVQLVDLGAGTSIVLNQFAEKTGFLDVAQAHGARVTFVFVLAPSADSINLLKILSDQHGDKIDYVVARNDAIPGTWDLWESSKTRARVLNDLGGMEIVIPLLDAEAFAYVDRKSLSWADASTSKDIPLASRSYIFRWVQKVNEQFDRAKESLR